MIPNDPLAADPLAERVGRLAEACRPLSPGRAGELDRLSRAVAFGHVPGQPGWPALRADLAATIGAETGPEARAYRAVALAGAMYADGLLEEPSIEAAIRAAEIEVAMAVPTEAPLLDPDAFDVAVELRRAADALVGRYPELGALALWLRGLAGKLEAVGEPPFPNAVEIALDALDPDLPLPVSEAARAGAGVLVGARELAARDLSRRGVELIAPLPGERLSGAEHEVVGDPGTRVGRLNRAGFRIAGRVERYASVQATD